MTIGEQILEYIVSAKLIARVDVQQDDGSFRADQPKVFVWSANAASQLTELVKQNQCKTPPRS